MTYRAALAFLALVVGTVGGGTVSAGEPWGTDTNAGDGPRLIDSAAPALARIVQASAEERPALVKAYAEGSAADHIEAVKRFRNPELHDLFRALAEHPEWKVRHRALFALEYYGDPDDLILALRALDAEEPRLREKAALTAIKLWHTKGRRALAEDPVALVSARLDAESDPHVVACLRALEARIDGKLLVRPVYEEHLEQRPDGLLVTPFLSGMNHVSAVAPSYRKKGVSESGGASAKKLPEGPWTTPIIRFGEEARSGMSLQPFANLRGGGRTYHTGLDIGACLDGGGYYALAPGIVKFVHSGSDMGTLIVVQHHVGAKRTVNAIYMHGGDTVFVKGGERVISGQLLCTMGMGYSIENGGHYAHLHFGLYPGEFSTTHNFGYRSVKAGLMDWYDPAHYVPLWVELGRPLVPTHRSRALLGKTVALLEAEKYGAAYAEAASHGEAGAALREELEQAVAGAVDRAAAMRDRGYPARALGFLETIAKSAKGIPGGEAVVAASKAWKKDPGFRKALKGEKKLLSVGDEAAGLVGNPAGAKTLWQALLETWTGSCLESRIRHRLDGVGG